MDYPATFAADNAALGQLPSSDTTPLGDVVYGAAKLWAGALIAYAAFASLSKQPSTWLKIGLVLGGVGGALSALYGAGMVIGGIGGSRE